MYERPYVHGTATSLRSLSFPSFCGAPAWGGNRREEGRGVEIECINVQCSTSVKHMFSGRGRFGSRIFELLWRMREAFTGLKKLRERTDEHGSASTPGRVWGLGNRGTA